MNKSQTRFSFFVLAILSIVWGSSFILIKKALIAFDPVLVGALRISISSIAFTPIVIYNFRKINLNNWKVFTVVGLTGSGIPAFMYAIAQSKIDSSVSGLLNSLTPIFAMIIGVLFFKVILSLPKIMGVLMGFLGAGIIMLASGTAGTENYSLYGLLIVIGTICYGTSVNVVKSYFQDTPSLIVSAVSFFLIGPPAIAYVIISDFGYVMTTHDHAWLSLGALVILSLIGTVISTIVFFRLVQMSNAIFASSVAFTIPIVAMFWGYLDGEHLGMYHFMGMLMILIGVFMIRRSK